MLNCNAVKTKKIRQTYKENISPLTWARRSALWKTLQKKIMVPTVWWRVGADMTILFYFLKVFILEMVQHELVLCLGLWCSNKVHVVKGKWKCGLQVPFSFLPLAPPFSGVTSAAWAPSSGGRTTPRSTVTIPVFVGLPLPVPTPVSVSAAVPVSVLLTLTPVPCNTAYSFHLLLMHFFSFLQLFFLFFPLLFTLFPPFSSGRFPLKKLKWNGDISTNPFKQ